MNFRFGPLQVEVEELEADVDADVSIALSGGTRHDFTFDIGERLEGLVERALGLPGARAVFTSLLVTERGQFVSHIRGDIRGAKLDTKQEVDIVIVPLNRRGEPTMVENPTLTS